MDYRTTVEETAPGPDSSNDVAAPLVAVVVAVVAITTVIGIVVAVISVMIYRHKRNGKNVQILG